MGCGGSNSGSLPVPMPKMRVHGDINNTDTRTVLVLMEAGGIPFNFKQAQINKVEERLSQMVDGLEDPTYGMNFIARNTPVVEDPYGHKILGGPQALLLFCAQTGSAAGELCSK